jgi:hypothetical protein
MAIEEDTAAAREEPMEGIGVTTKPDLVEMRGGDHRHRSIESGFVEIAVVNGRNPLLLDHRVKDTVRRAIL